MQLQRQLGNQAVMRLLKSPNHTQIQRVNRRRRGAQVNTTRPQIKDEEIASPSQIIKSMQQGTNDISPKDLEMDSHFFKKRRHFHQMRGRRGAIRGNVSPNSDELKQEVGTGNDSGWDQVNVGVDNLQNTSTIAEQVFTGFGHDGGTYEDTTAQELNENNAAAQFGMTTFEKDEDGKFSGSETGLGHGFAISGNVVGMGAAGARTFTGLFNMAGNLKSAYGARADKKTMAMYLSKALLGDLSSTAVHGATTANQAAATTTQAVKASGTDVGSAQDIIGSIGSSLGTLGDAIETAKSGATLIYQGVQLKRAISSGSKRTEAALEFSKEGVNLIKSGLSTLKGVLSTAKEILGAVQAVTEPAKQFTQAMPFVGAAVNIVLSALDIIMQGITMAGQALKVHRARKNRQKITDVNLIAWIQNINLPDEQQAALKHLYEVSTKRIKRGALNLTSTSMQIIGDLGHIGSAIASIVGEATAAAYGVGVGIKAGSVAGNIASSGVKLTGASVTVGARLLRFTKQKLRDAAAQGKFGKNKIGKYRVFNTDKTSDKKTQRYIDTTATIFQTIANLPENFDNEKNKYQYEMAMVMLKATGVSKKALFKETDVNKQAALLIEAMRERE